MSYLVEHGFSILDREKENKKHKDRSIVVSALTFFLDDMGESISDKREFVRKKIQLKYVDECGLSLGSLRDGLSLTGMSCLACI